MAIKAESRYQSGGMSKINALTPSQVINAPTSVSRTLLSLQMFVTTASGTELPDRKHR